MIESNNKRSGDYQLDLPRPSHADYTAKMRFGQTVDLRGGGHFSGRLTAPLCIVGGICLQYLASRGIEIAAHLYAVGGVYDKGFDLASVGQTEFDILKQRAEFPVLDESAGEGMRAAIRAAADDGDSVGGIVECAALGLPAGLGEHMFDGVENRLSSILFGIPAVKGVEFGVGFDGISMRGSEYNDAFVTDGTRITTRTNHVGGILGGITTGMPVVFRAAIKPTASIAMQQQSVSLAKLEEQALTVHGRHDPCIVPRAVPVIEAAAAIAFFDVCLSDGRLLEA